MHSRHNCDVNEDNSLTNDHLRKHYVSVYIFVTMNVFLCSILAYLFWSELFQLRLKSFFAI
jgi:hypothetical protein